MKESMPLNYIEGMPRTDYAITKRIAPYTQLTDIEQEQNGLFFYDRTKKFEDTVYAKIREVNNKVAKIEKIES